MDFAEWLEAQRKKIGITQSKLADPQAHLEARRQQFDTGALTDERAQIDKAVAAFDAGKQRWDHAYEIGSIPLDELLRHRREIAGETVRLDDRRQEIDGMLAGIDAATDSLDQVRDLAPLLPTLDLPALRQVYHALIHHIALRSGEDPVIAWL